MQPTQVPKSQPIPSLLFSIVRKYTCIYYYHSCYCKVSKYGKMQRFKSNIFFSRINSKKFPIGVYAVIFHSTACKELLAYVISIFQSFHSKSMQYNRENNLLLTWLNRWHWSPFWKNLCILLIAEKVGPRARQIFYKRYFILSALSIRVHETSRVEVPCECKMWTVSAKYTARSRVSHSHHRCHPYHWLVRSLSTQQMRPPSGNTAERDVSPGTELLCSIIITAVLIVAKTLSCSTRAKSCSCNCIRNKANKRAATWHAIISGQTKVYAVNAHLGARLCTFEVGDNAISPCNVTRQTCSLSEMMESAVPEPPTLHNFVWLLRW